MQYIKGHTYKWVLNGNERKGTFTGKVDNFPGFEDYLIMENEEGILWSISPQYIIEEVK